MMMTAPRIGARRSRRRSRGKDLRILAAIAGGACVAAALAAPGTPAHAAGQAAGRIGTQAAAPTPAVIAVDAASSLGTVHKGTLGQAYLWPFGGMGSFSEQTGQFDDSFLRQLKDVVEPGSLRYPGGITAEAFHWERAVGPQDQRTPNAFGPASGPSTSSVGPDEFGQLLDATRAQGVITANFGTGSAQEAAAFVAYMTGAPGSSTWADMRVRNGHRAPYDVPYWEVGNEEYDTDYWRTGTPVTVDGPAGACQSIATCLYIYGGSTKFTQQSVVGYADRTTSASHSSGAGDQSFYVAYPPVAAGSAAVYVDGTAWTQVDSLAASGPSDHDFVLDDGTGQINFGDGVHGAVPPSGAQITATYTSGPHDGFLQFYQEMKAANPAIKVCSSDTTDDFIESMGSTLPYDCLQSHTYTSTSTVANDVPIDAYQDQMMAGADSEAASVASLQATIRQYAGRDIPLVETEYGQLLSSSPDSDPDYHESLDQALLNATQLANWIRLGIPVADRQLLAAEIPPDTQCCAGLPGAAPFAGTASIGTPGPDTVLEATGELYRLFAPLAGGTILNVQTLNNPPLPDASTAGTGALSVLAVRESQHLELLVINRSTTADVSTRLLLPGVGAAGRASYQRLDGPSSLSYNTVAWPGTVELTSGTVATIGSDLQLGFPAHSVTRLSLPLQQAQAAPPLTAQLSAPAPAAPGSQLTLHATISNDGPMARSGLISAVVPAGWSSPPAARYTVGAHSQASVELHVTVPAAAAEGQDALGAIVFGRGRSVAGFAAATSTVRDLQNWTPVVSDSFDDQQVGVPPSDYTVTGPSGSFLVQPSPSGPGQALQISKTQASAGLITADRTFAPVTGPVRFVIRAWADQTDTSLGIQLHDQSGAAVVMLSLATSADLAWSNGSSFVRGASYGTGQWNTYELDLDPGAGTYKLYINNVLTATASLNTSAGPPADIHLQMPASPATPGTFDVDDISVSVPAASG